MSDRQSANFDLGQLLHPAQAFSRPSEVVNDPDLTLNEKRAILAAWALDACAVEAAPELRKSPGGPVVRFDDIMDALRTLDAQFCHDLSEIADYASTALTRSASFEQRRSRCRPSLICKRSCNFRG
jgi:hypothetical protein